MWLTKSSQYAQGSGGLISECIELCDHWATHLEPSATSNGKHIPRRSWLNKFKRGTWTNALSGWEISEDFPLDPWLEQIGYVEDTRVKHSAYPGSVGDSMTLGQSGPESSTLSIRCCLGAYFLKTSTDTSRWGCSESCATWKDEVSRRNGGFIRRRKSARRTLEKESLSSECKTTNWPTPKASDWKMGSAGGETPTNGHLGRAVPRDPTSPEGQLSADWLEMLMGFPQGWTDLGPTE